MWGQRLSKEYVDPTVNMTAGNPALKLINAVLVFCGIGFAKAEAYRDIKI